MAHFWAPMIMKFGKEPDFTFPSDIIYKSKNNFFVKGYLMLSSRNGDEKRVKVLVIFTGRAVEIDSAAAKAT